MSRIFIISLMMLLSVMGISTLPTNHSDAEIEKFEDYPSDTHAGAEKAFSQLVSDDSIGSRANRGDDDEAEAGGKALSGDTKSLANKDGNADLKVDEFDDSDDSETQYLIEEIYGYTYDEATDTDFEDSSVSKKDNFSSSK